MANRPYPYVVLLRRVNEGSATDETYDVDATNVNRAVNKAKKERAADDGCEPNEFQAMECYRDRNRFRETK